VGSVVRAFTDPSKVHWTEYADQIADAFANSPLPTNEKLETIATAVNNQAATIREAQ